MALVPLPDSVSQFGRAPFQGLRAPAAGASVLSPDLMSAVTTVCPKTRFLSLRARVSSGVMGSTPVTRGVSSG